ncbi:MAG: Nuclear envelope morphology protein 1 [Bathelium mastoideum]|nr:MAG: Nuclear envelope morphology protein 1 [Bathelium mastoideum]
MNSLKTLSGFTSTPPASPPRSRTASEAQIEPLEKSSEAPGVKALGYLDSQAVAQKLSKLGDRVDDSNNDREDAASEVAGDEKIPLIDQDGPEQRDVRRNIRWALPKRVAAAIVSSIRVVLSAVLAPGRYVIAYFYDDQGHFSAVLPLRHLGRSLRKKSTAQAVGLSATEGQEPQFASRTRGGGKKISNPPSVASSAVTSEDEAEHDQRDTSQPDNDTPSKHTRSKSAASSGKEKQARKIRIKDNKVDSMKKRKQQKSSAESEDKNEQIAAQAAALLKSPTSPATASSLKVTRYPRTPAPPRPLIPRQQPLYSMPSPGFGRTGQKTLIIDLDETLIHSMAKGGRMSTGHMVEVKLSHPVGAGGVTIGSQIPILYYVHKRPHCDDFLRKVKASYEIWLVYAYQAFQVSKWYNLVVFTASVQEYADPVIDLLEQERKFFSGRYYRQHCTYRNGAYIKDLSQIEPDLSKVMILDNSPMSYIFHEDNAIPIEGWINDPTDNDLLHLIPLLEGLQYVMDVRALLALRLGEAQTI